MMRTLMLLGFTALALHAQSSGGPPPPAENMAGYEATVIPVKTLTGDSFRRLRSLLNVFTNARISADENLRTVIVYAPKDVTAQVRKVVAELDRPDSEAAIGRNIDLTMTFLRCYVKAPPAGMEPKPVPAEYDSVAKQLRSVTQFKECSLWDSIPFRLQEGKRAEQTTRLSGALTSPQATVFPVASATLVPEAVSHRASGTYVRFDQVRVNFKIPYVQGSGGYNFIDLGLSTSGDFKEGQKSVLGKVNGSDDEAIFVVLSLKVLD